MAGCRAWGSFLVSTAGTQQRALRNGSPISPMRFDENSEPTKANPDVSSTPISPPMGGRSRLVANTLAQYLTRDCD
ncbi:lipoprotein [Anopheles sinensis]|uniref:Lipoprotein n=1 Tax=Anopheles sinensis TaxID=74873 RepID=A0A084WL33_ANOSI|nr:lipoprotein [Anopheles sinensis]